MGAPPESRWVRSELRRSLLVHVLQEIGNSEAYVSAGGKLPKQGRLARIIDLIALCESLTHDAQPSQVGVELATFQNTWETRKKLEA